jgi:hypothetical protein
VGNPLGRPVPERLRISLEHNFKMDLAQLKCEVINGEANANTAYVTLHCI